MINSNPSDIAFYFELVEFYNQNKKILRRKLRIKKDSDLLDFCCAFHAVINDATTSHLCSEYVYKLAYILANVMGKQLPSHIHNRIILEPNNIWTKKYVEYIKNLKPYWIVNTNKNEFKWFSLSYSGDLKKLALK